MCVIFDKSDFKQKYLHIYVFSYFGILNFLDLFIFLYVRLYTYFLISKKPRFVHESFLLFDSNPTVKMSAQFDNSDVFTTVKDSVLVGYSLTTLTQTFLL